MSKRVKSTFCCEQGTILTLVEKVSFFWVSFVAYIVILKFGLYAMFVLNFSGFITNTRELSKVENASKE